MLVVGGGYIGLEQADAYAGLGSRVSVVEALPQIMSWGDPELVAILRKQLEKRFESILVNTRVVEARERGRRHVGPTRRAGGQREERSDVRQAARGRGADAELRQHRLGEHEGRSSTARAS